MQQRSLIDAFGTPEQVLAAPQREIVAAIKPEASAALEKGPAEGAIARALAWAGEPGNYLLTYADPRYPALLRQIPDPPMVLYAQGRIELLNEPAFAIVGSRNATTQGASDAEAFAAALSNAGLCIVSGLALGIDGAAHRGGLRGASSTIAVLGTGADRIYPRDHEALARTIGKQGVLVSEFALGTPILPENFPRRNRLISGLARGVLVVEAAEKSGSLGTAQLALEQNREVFAMPGSIHSTVSKGCHRLIKEGAKLVEEAADILAELHMEVPEARAKTAAGKSGDPLLDMMGFTPMTIDEMAACMKSAAAAISARISLLEVEGRIAALPGGLFQRLPRMKDRKGRVIE